MLNWHVSFFNFVLFTDDKENVELEKARQEWEALEHTQPGQINLAVCRRMIMTLLIFGLLVDGIII